MDGVIRAKITRIENDSVGRGLSRHGKGAPGGALDPGIGSRFSFVLF
jgi:hypothetical protein